MTTVTDTILNGAGDPVSGTMFITANSQFEGASGQQVYEQPITIAIGVDGVFTVDLIPNDTATPSGTSYNVNFSLDGPPGFPGQNPEETWVVPTSGSPVGLEDVRTSPTPIPDAINYLPLTGGIVTGKLTLSPASGTYALDVTKSGSSGTVRIHDQTASTGVTSVGVRAGAGQSATNLFLWQDSSGTTMGGVGSGGDVFSVQSGARKVTMYQNSLLIASDAYIGWKDQTNLDTAGTFDTWLMRSGVGVLKVADGSGNPRDLLARSVILTTSTPASAAATGVTGTIAWDSSYIYICVATDTWKRVAIATW